MMEISEHAAPVNGYNAGSVCIEVRIASLISAFFRSTAFVPLSVRNSRKDASEKNFNVK